MQFFITNVHGDRVACELKNGQSVRDIIEIFNRAHPAFGADTLLSEGNKLDEQLIYRDGCLWDSDENIGVLNQLLHVTIECSSQDTKKIDSSSSRVPDELTRALQGLSNKFGLNAVQRALQELEVRTPQHTSAMFGSTNSPRARAAAPAAADIGDSSSSLTTVGKPGVGVPG